MLADPDPDLADPTELGPHVWLKVGSTGCEVTLDGRRLRWDAAPGRGHVLVHRAMLEHASVPVPDLSSHGDGDVLLVGDSVHDLPNVLVVATTSQMKAVARVQTRVGHRARLASRQKDVRGTHKTQARQANGILRRWIASASMQAEPVTLSCFTVTAGLTMAYAAWQRGGPRALFGQYLYDGTIVKEPVILFVVLDDKSICEELQPGVLHGFFEDEDEDADHDHGDD